MKRGVRTLVVGPAAMSVLSGTVLAHSPAARAVLDGNPLPGGRSYYVTTIGNLDPRTPTKNWVRLSFYRFDPDGNAYMGYWHWSSAGKYGEVEVLKTCGYNCPFFTVPQYLHNGPKQVSGTYAVSGDRLTISWASGGRETWTISSRKDNLASLVLVPAQTNYPTTHGRGYGSTTGWNKGADATAIYNRYRSKANPDGVWSLHGESHQWLWRGSFGYNEMRHTYGPTVFEPTIRHCSWQCLTVDDGSASYYYATTSTALPRKLMREMFVNSHKVNNCYTSSQPNGVHAHLIPALEIIDDAKQFRGWVSVEVSMWPNPERYTDYMGVNWYLSTS